MLDDCELLELESESDRGTAGSNGASAKVHSSGTLVLWQARPHQRFQYIPAFIFALWSAKIWSSGGLAV
jgi:hypothetical protein